MIHQLSVHQLPHRADDKHKFVDFDPLLMEEIDKEISEMKLLVNAREHFVAEEYLKNV